MLEKFGKLAPPGLAGQLLSHAVNTWRETLTKEPAHLTRLFGSVGSFSSMVGSVVARSVPHGSLSGREGASSLQKNRRSLY